MADLKVSSVEAEYDPDHGEYIVGIRVPAGPGDAFVAIRVILDLAAEAEEFAKRARDLAFDPETHCMRPEFPEFGNACRFILSARPIAVAAPVNNKKN